ncbi:MAG TPA: hypothetical protein VLZ12_16240 [Verrucomicrobiae bacterium]|nr:hypothetical protein [Verrucomicrobiae bacterium]
MKKIAVALCVAAALAAGTFVLAQTQTPPRPPLDPRIDKLLEQNEKILQNQDEILKTLADMKESILILKRRSS